jgi:CBS domain-containing protein
MIVEHLSPLTATKLRTVTEDVPVRAVAHTLSRLPIGLVVVCDEAGRTTGVVSKSDLVRHLSRSGASTAPVADIMTRRAVECSQGELLRDAWEQMRARNLQNMPVVDASRRPLGVLDVRDALQAILREEQDQEHLLIDYIAGVGYR